MSIGELEEHEEEKLQPWDVARQAVKASIIDQGLTSSDIKQLNLQGMIDLFKVKPEKNGSLPTWFEWEPEKNRLCLELEQEEQGDASIELQTKIENALKTDPTLADIKVAVASDGKIEITNDKLRAQ